MTRVTIPAPLAAEIAADLAAGGDRARRWRPAPPGDRFAPVLVLQGADRAGQDAAGHVGEVRGITTAGGYPNVTEVIVLMPGEWFGEATAWAPVGGVDGGPRPDIGDRVLILEVLGGYDEPGQIGTIGMVDNILGRIGVDLNDGGSALATKWAVLPPEIPAEVHALRDDLDQALNVPAGLASIIGQPTPGEASTPDSAHGDGDMYELTVRIPMTVFGGAPNDDPRIDQVIDAAMGLFPGAEATGGPAWPEDGPTQCPTCGAVDRDERRHRAHEDGEATLRDLVRWLTTERDRLRSAAMNTTSVDGNLDLARSAAMRRVLDRLRDQGLDVDYLGEPATVPDVVAREALETGDAT